MSSLEFMCMVCVNMNRPLFCPPSVWLQCCSSDCPLWFQMLIYVWPRRAQSWPKQVNSPTYQPACSLEDQRSNIGTLQVSLSRIVFDLRGTYSKCVGLSWALVLSFSSHWQEQLCLLKNIPFWGAKIQLFHCTHLFVEKKKGPPSV